MNIFNRTSAGLLILCIVVLIQFCAQACACQNSSGSDSFQLALDQAINRFMQTTGASSATIAISRDGVILIQKGYGFSDSQQKMPTLPSRTMRIASCTKPVTRAAIHTLVAQGKLQMDTPVFDYLGISPGDGGLVDPRIKSITIENLLHHTGGWNMETTFDPLYRIEEIGREFKVTRVQKHHIVKYMWSQPLQADPGAEEHYSNFGFLLLGMAIEKATGKSYIESIRESICEPLGIDDFAISASVRSHRSSREVYYPNDSRLDLRLRDSASGLVASAPSMCKFMAAWWIDGTPRTDDRNMFFYQIGSHPMTTSTFMEQRLDGIDYVMMFNARREDSWREDNLEIRRQINLLLDTFGE